MSQSPESYKISSICSQLMFERLAWSLFWTTPSNAVMSSLTTSCLAQAPWGVWRYPVAFDGPMKIVFVTMTNSVWKIASAMEFLVSCIHANDNMNLKYVVKKSKQYRRHVMSWFFAFLELIACTTAQLHKLPTTFFTAIFVLSHSSGQDNWFRNPPWTRHISVTSSWR